MSVFSCLDKKVSKFRWETECYRFFFMSKKIWVHKQIILYRHVQQITKYLSRRHITIDPLAKSLINSKSYSSTSIYEKGKK